MKNPITCTSVDILRSDDKPRASADRFTVSVDGPMNDLIEQEFFQKYNIGSLDFKCAAWSRVTGAATKATIAALKPVLAKHAGLKPENLDLHYSRYAGCSCGCSPGYVGKIINAPWYDGILRRAYVFMDVVPSELAMAHVRTVMEDAAAKLPNEIIRGNAKVAAQRAEDARIRAEQKVKDEQEEAEHKARWAKWDADEKERFSNAALNSASL